MTGAESLRLWIPDISSNEWGACGAFWLYSLRVVRYNTGP